MIKKFLAPIAPSELEDATDLPLSKKLGWFLGLAFLGLVVVGCSAYLLRHILLMAQ